MIEPYFSDGFVTLYHGNAFEVMESMEDRSVDCVITDPPYSDRTHKYAKSNRGATNKTSAKNGINFDAFDDAHLMAAFDEMARLTNSWIVSTMDYNHAFGFEKNPPAGMIQKRIGVWVKTNPMPQISADRPSQGWDAISYLHRVDTKSEWNGGGSHGNYVSSLAQPTGHPTPKPISMVSSFVERFSNIGDTILDPFAGGGTTLLAARNLSRKVIGVELDERYCELIANRLSQQAFDFGSLEA